VAHHKKILIGITGSIAAYKVATLVRLLVKNGNEVRCIMTEGASKFISPLTIATLSKSEVYQDFFKDGVWANHVELGLWADVLLIAPCTAHTLSKLASGHADNMLVATYLSAKCPVFIAPAMDLDMWHHGSTTENLKKVTGYGNVVMPVGYGELASGLVGDGRMAEPEEIAKFLEDHFAKGEVLRGKKMLITAGPTYEHIDPVRFIGNHSTGKMGLAIAEQAVAMGAEVHLVLGPSSLKPAAHINTTRVTSAQQMYEASAKDFESYDIVVWSAAVADYTPQVVAAEKIKKSDPTLEITLGKTIDIALTLGKKRKENQVIVGFALETNNEEQNAIQKIHKKNLDFVVLNSLQDKGAGFGHDTNLVTIIKKSGDQIKYPLKSKSEVATDIMQEIVNELLKK
jgi:phosphopantothenoylcysteine decarboxylase / phosphopantothenate---cysteine ligase